MFKIAIQPKLTDYPCTFMDIRELKKYREGYWNRSQISDHADTRFIS